MMQILALKWLYHIHIQCRGLRLLLQVRLPVYLHPSPTSLCVWAHRCDGPVDVRTHMWMWKYVCTSTCAHLCPPCICVCVWYRCAQRCFRLWASLCPGCMFLCTCVCRCIYIPMHFASMRKYMHVDVSVYMQVCDTCMSLDLTCYFQLFPALLASQKYHFFPIPASQSCHSPRLQIFFGTWGLCPVLLGEQKAITAI